MVTRVVILKIRNRSLKKVTNSMHDLQGLNLTIKVQINICLDHLARFFQVKTNDILLSLLDKENGNKKCKMYHVVA